MNSCHQLKTKLISEGMWSILGGNDWTNSSLEIRNEKSDFVSFLDFYVIL